MILFLQIIRTRINDRVGLGKKFQMNIRYAKLAVTYLGLGKGVFH